MAAVKGYKVNAPGFTGEMVQVEVTYDFSKDAGAQGALDIFKAAADCVLVDCYTKVDTTCTSGGSATLIWGPSTDTDGCLAAAGGAVANLTGGAVIKGDAAGKQIKIAKDTVFSMTIGTAALTAGKVRFVLCLAKF